MDGSCDVRRWLEHELFSYLDPLKSHYSEGHARLLLAGGATLYERDVLSFEAWARPLWGLAPFWAGGGRSADGFFEKAYLEGLIAGTDPASAEYWGGFRAHDQRFVELAAIAYGILLAPEVLWEPLPEEAKARLAAWLIKVNGQSYPEGNWLWFRVLVNLALRERGQEWSEAALKADLAKLDGFYLGNGWYQDGPGGVLDYYNAMAFHFFGLLYGKLFCSSDPVRSEALRERAARFAEDYVLLFSTRGEAVPFGRSLTYRFAQAGFWSEALAARADLGPALTLGCLLGLVVRNIASFDRTAIADNGGVQTIGYRYPCLHMAEGYNGFGSPYWSLMAFACLALPADDPLWEQKPEPLPELPALAQTPLGLVARDREGEVTLFRIGPLPRHPFAQSAAKYGKFTYSTRFGLSVARSERSIEEAAPDSTLAFVAEGRVFVPEGPQESCVRQRRASDIERLAPGLDKRLRDALEDRGQLWETWSSWAPCPGIEVETEIVPLSSGHLRIHQVRTDAPCMAYDCGFAVPGNYHLLSDEEAFAVCSVRALAAPGEGLSIHAEANTNISHPESVIPAVRYEVRQGATLLVTLVTC